MLAAMFPGFSEEQIVQKIAADQQQQAMKMAQMEHAIAAAQTAGLAAGGGTTGGATGKGGDWHQGTGAWESGGFPRVMLGEKHFRRVDKFEGNPAKFKSRTFDLITAVGSVDLSLAKDLKEQLKARPKIETDEGVFKIPADVLIDENHERYIEKQSHKFVKKPGSLAKS